jgi:hypothetical protein
LITLARPTVSLPLAGLAVFSVCGFVYSLFGRGTRVADEKRAEAREDLFGTGQPEI